MVQPAQLISEPVTVAAEDMGTPAAVGEPGVPHALRWRRTRYEIAEVLERWKSHGDCTHGSGERYLRRHWLKARCTDGTVMTLYFERRPRRGAKPGASRWYLYGLD